MFLSRPQVFLNYFKYKRRFNCVTAEISIRWESTGLKILFFGTDSFSLPSLKKINEERFKNKSIKSIDVVTSFKNPKNCVRHYAEDNKLELLKWPVHDLISNRYDLGVVVSFGHLIPEKIISSFSLGIINVHASALPRWRGAAPIIYALKNGDRKTGVTIMKVEPKRFDIGDILAQKDVEIHDDMLLPELYSKMAEEGANLLVDSVNRFPEILKEAKSQDENQATYAPKITPEICEVDWNNQNALQIYNLYRALYSYKNLTTKWQNQTVKLIELSYSPSSSSLIDTSKKPGFVEFHRLKKCLRIFCTNGSVIEVTKVCIEGRKTMTAIDFNNGFLKECSTDKRYFVHQTEVMPVLKKTKLRSN